LGLRIWLDKNTYDAGETAKGTLLIKANSVLKVRKFTFSVCGKERYLEETKNSKGGIVRGLVRSKEAEKYDIFFFEDLSPFLKSTSSLSYIDDRIEIPQGPTAIPFHFSIPTNALESYRGKYALIKYEVEVHVNIGRWKGDNQYTLTFDVTNPRMTYTFEDSLYLGKETVKKEGQPYLRLELETKNGTSDVPIFFPGEVIQGRLIIEQGGPRRVRKAIIQLSGVEHSKWRRSKIISQTIKEEIRYDRNKDMDTVAFGIQIPRNAKRSYSAKYSEYYWLLETQVDITNRPTFHAKKVVQIA
jgi:Arrestin (or S-antigen), N-terminal domain